MAIPTNALVNFWEGAYDSLANTPAAVASGNFSIASDLNIWTNADDSPYISCILEIDPAALPAAGGYVFLYAQLLDLITTVDAPVPTANFPETPVGRFLVKDDAAAQTIYGEFFLPASKTQQQYQFYIKNGTTVQIDATAWDLNVDSKTVGAKA